MQLANWPTGQLEINLHTADEEICVVFEDSEPGVSNEQLPLLFERLYRAENSRNRKTGGSGLGLSICQALVRAHGGHMNAEHAAQGGLKITVKLPVHHD